MRSVVIIPARYQSSRFPGKPLTLLLGKPMVLWVAEIAAKAVGQGNVFIATEDERIAKVVTKNGFQIVMTSSEALTGTDRVAEAAEKIKADIYVNLQGDEPVVDYQDIQQIIDKKISNMEKIICGCCLISKNENPESVNIPKIITNEGNKLVYASRRAIPGYKDAKNAQAFYQKQVCIYAFTKQELLDFRGFGRKSKLEFMEDIEILRFLELNRDVLMVETKGQSLAVDVPEDIKPVEEALKNIHGY